jgi:pSer/pThr/pTyr-binding forkhead associated (FHA) protein
MNLDVALLVLRLLGAALLLAFLGFIVWLIYQDMRLTAAQLANRQREHGRLRIIASESQPELVARDFPLLVVTSIGRAPHNSIVLDDGYTSSEHALISLRGRQWWLEDLGSRNGTLLNTVTLDSPAVLSAGDLITVGDTQLKIELVV